MDVSINNTVTNIVSFEQLPEFQVVIPGHDTLYMFISWYVHMFFKIRYMFL